MQEKEKSRRIVDELLTYFLSHDIEQIILEVSYSEEGVLVMAQGYCEELPEDIYEFVKLLNVPRDLSIENYYDELLGAHHSLHEEKDYNLLGMMIDNADIMYENNLLMIEVFRQNYYK